MKNFVLLLSCMFLGLTVQAMENSIVPTSKYLRAREISGKRSRQVPSVVIYEQFLEQNKGVSPKACCLK